jgi:hypothetical protein
MQIPGGPFASARLFTTDEIHRLADRYEQSCLKHDVVLVTKSSNACPTTPRSGHERERKED